MSPSILNRLENHYKTCKWIVIYKERYSKSFKNDPLLLEHFNKIYDDLILNLTNLEFEVDDKEYVPDNSLVELSLQQQKEIDEWHMNNS